MKKSKSKDFKKGAESFSSGRTAQNAQQQKLNIHAGISVLLGMYNFACAIASNQNHS